MTAAVVHDRAAGKRAPKIAWTRLPGQGLAGRALGVVLCTSMVLSGAVFVVLSF
ncbi:MAG: hypothetical protein QM608_05305 [Caulobacter sp.]